MTAYRRPEEALDAMEGVVRAVLDGRGFRLSVASAHPIVADYDAASARYFREQETPFRELAALGAIRLCRSALREGDAHTAALAMHEATARFAFVRTPDVAFEDRMRGLEARHHLAESAPAGAESRRARYAEHDEALRAKARAKWNGRPRDVRRVAKALHREGADPLGRSLERIRKVIAPALR